MHQKFLIHGLPRSGTSWIGEIFNSSPHTRYCFQPLFSYALKGALGEHSGADEINAFYKELTSIEDDFIDQVAARREGRLPEFDKSEITHVGYKEVRYHHILGNLFKKDSGLKGFLILRNPMAVINSWLNAPREFRPDLGWNRLEEWRHAEKKNLGRKEEFNGYAKWKEASLMFINLAHQYPDRVMLLRYESWSDQPLPNIEQAFSFMNLKLEQQTLDFVSPDECADDDAYSVMKSGVNHQRWRDELEPEIISAIEQDLDGSPLEFLLREP